MSTRFQWSLLIGLLIIFLPVFFAFGDKSFAAVGWVYMFYSVPAGLLLIFFGPFFLFVIEKLAETKIGKLILGFAAVFLLFAGLISELYGGWPDTNEKLILPMFLATVCGVVCLTLFNVLSNQKRSSEKNYWLNRTRKQFRSEEDVR